MKKPIAILVMILAFDSICCYGAEIEGGHHQVGNGSSGNGTAPGIDTGIDYPNGPNPGNYSSPTFHKGGSTNNTTSLNASYSDPFNYTYSFNDVGSVVGTGRHSEWRSVFNVTGVSAKQTSSATTGDLNRSRILVVSNQAGDTSRGGLIFSRNNLLFIGESYKETENYKNNGDLIKNYLTSGAIIKESSYTGAYAYWLETSHDMEKYGNQTALKRSAYQISTRLTGVYDFQAVMPGNSTYIEEYAIGQLAINRNIENRETFTRVVASEDWIPCCLSLATPSINKVYY